jgi:signal transduction histidine kinase
VEGSTKQDSTQDPRLPVAGRRSAAQERAALAHDLHAGLAQATTATMLGLDILRTSLTADTAPPPDVIDRLDELATWSGREIRRLLAFLRTPRDRGLSDTLRQYFDEVETEDTPITLDVTGHPGSDDAAESAFRFIHGTLGVLYRKRSVGPVAISVLSTIDAVTVRIRATVAWPRGSKALDAIAADAGADPIVIRTNNGTLSIEAVIR